MSATYRGPIAATGLWIGVVDAAGGQCQCTGCDSKHTKSGGRCERLHTNQAGRRLMVAPADTTLSDVAAVTLPASELRAWCSDCYRSTRRRALAAQAPAPSVDALFEI